MGDLIEAIQDNDLNQVQTLLRAGADPNRRDEYGDTALIEAAWNGHLPAIQALLKAGANVDQQSANGVTALTAAAAEGFYDAVQALLQAGADPNHKGYKGRTALMRAAARGNKPVVKALLEAGADPNLRDEEGNTVFDLASPEVTEYIRGFRGGRTKSAVRRARMHRAPDAGKIYRLKRDLNSYPASDIDLLKGYYGVTADDRDDVLWMIAVENYRLS